MEDCIFCKIANKSCPCYQIYEDEKTLAFLDISNDIYGHTLVIPKKHCVNILDCDKDTLSAVTATVQKIAKHYISLGFDGVNIINANEKSAGQSVFHLHFHVIPRKSDDGEHVFPKFKGCDKELQEVQKSLKF